MKVVSPIDGTPAARAGIQAGDYLTAINGESIVGLTLNEAVTRMRGEAGTDITITIAREDSDPFDVTLTPRNHQRPRRHRARRRRRHRRHPHFNLQRAHRLDAARRDPHREARHRRASARRRSRSAQQSGRPARSSDRSLRRLPRWRRSGFHARPSAGRHPALQRPPRRRPRRRAGGGADQRRFSARRRKSLRARSKTATAR